MIDINFTQKDKYVQLNINTANQSQKQIIFDSNRCNGILIAYKDESEIEQFIESLSDTNVPDNIDLIELNISDTESDVDSLVDSIVESIDENTSQGITTYLFLKDATDINIDLINLMRFRRDGTVKLFSFINESKIDTKAGKVKGYKLESLNDPFIFQIIIYLNDETNKVYNVDTFYRNLSRKK